MAVIRRRSTVVEEPFSTIPVHPIDQPPATVNRIDLDAVTPLSSRQVEPRLEAAPAAVSRSIAQNPQYRELVPRPVPPYPIPYHTQSIGSVIGLTEALESIEKIDVTAGVSLGGHRAVYVQDRMALYASSDDDLSCDLLTGITMHYADQGSLIKVHTDGEVQESSWNWEPDRPVFLGLMGMLTQTPPAAGAIVQIGLALEPTVLLVRIEPALFLAEG